jgi:nitric oxide reductase NorD protein
VLLTDWINQVGDPSVIHGFCSDGRHDVEYYRFKDFDQHWDEVPKAKLAGMTGQLSTRSTCATTPRKRWRKSAVTASSRTA